MATTQEELDQTMVEIGSAIKSVKNLIGLLTGLSTTDKTSIVNAINEIYGRLGSAGAVIDDNAASSTKVYSSVKVVQAINDARASLKSEILGGAGTTVDTLKEIADLLASSDIDDDNAIAALTIGLGKRVRFDTSQTLTAAEKVQANANMGSVSLAQFGDPAHSYKSVFLSALNS